MVMAGVEEYHHLISQLMEAARLLLHPSYDSDDELQQLLDKLETLLLKVDQLEANNDYLMKQTLEQPMEALLSPHLLQHSRKDVKASVACCLCEIIRITAPEAPYVKEQMKRVFECIVSSVEDMSAHNLAKMVSIIRRVSQVQSCLIMLNLNFDDLIVRLFRQFFKSVGSDDNLFKYMENIMVLVIEESDEVSPALLETLKQTWHVDTTESKLRDEVMNRCATKLRPCNLMVDHGDTATEIVSSDDAAAHVNGETKYAIVGEAKKPEGTVGSNFASDSVVEEPPEIAVAVQKPLEENEVANTPSLQSGSQQEDSQNKIQIEKGIRSKEKGLSQTNHPSPFIALTKVNEGASDLETKLETGGGSRLKRKRKEVRDEGSVAKKSKLSGNETNLDVKPVKTTSGGVSEPDDDVNNKDVESESDDMPSGKNGQKRNLASRPSEDDAANKDGETLNVSENKDEHNDSDRRLRFLCENYDTSQTFSDFVEDFLGSRRDIDVFSVELTFCAKIVSPETIECILKYAIPRKLQELNIRSLHYKEEWFELCPSLLNSQYLKHLTLVGYNHRMTSFTWDLPALVTLNLYHLKIYNSYERVVFSLTSCTKLEKLTMKNCRLMCRRGFDIEHGGLTSLTLEEGWESRTTTVCVDVHRLEIITIRNWPNIRLYITPSLSSLSYIDYKVDPREEDYGDDPCEEDYEDDSSEEDNGDDSCEEGDYAESYYQRAEYPLVIFNEKLSCLKNVLICIDRPVGSEKDISKWISLLRELLPHVRSLTLNSEFAKILASRLESYPPLPLHDLKDVKVFPLVVCTPERVDKVEFKFKQLHAQVPDNLKNYFKITFPGVEIHEHKEGDISSYNYKLAENLIEDLNVLFKGLREKSLVVKNQLKQGVGLKCVSIPADERLEISATICNLTASLLRMIKIALRRVLPSSASANLHDMYSTLYAEHVTLIQMLREKSLGPRFI